MSSPLRIGFVLGLAFASLAPAVQKPLPPPEATEQWSPVPPVVTAPPGGVPSDAIALFDGQNLDAWESATGDSAPAPWKIDGDAITPGSGDICTKRSFGDVQLHLEFRTPTEIKGHGQNRGNSGVFFMGRYAVHGEPVSYRNVWVRELASANP